MSTDIKIFDKPFYLVEFHPGGTEVPMFKADGSFTKRTGYKLSRVVDKDCKELASAKPTEDGINLSCLPDKDFYLVSVNSFKRSETLDSKQDTTLQWLIMTIGASDPDKTEFVLSGIRKASGEEKEYLNKIFPEYFEHCSLDTQEFIEKNKSDIKV